MTKPEENKLYIKEVVLKFKTTRRVSANLDSPLKVFNYFKKKIGDDTQENFVAIYLNNKNMEVGWRLISKGTITETVVHPREIFSGALLCCASSMIVLHNHPSGLLTPSSDDCSATRRLVEASKIMGIELLDHVIISDKDYLSMKEEGYL